MRVIIRFGSTEIESPLYTREAAPAEFDDETPPRRRWWLRRTAIVLAVLLVAGAALTWVVRGAGQWLVVQDELEPAQAIVILSGRMPIRAREAAKLYQQGFASQVWVTRPAGVAETLKEMGIDYVGEEFYNEKVLIAQGVPFDAIRVLDNPVVNTEQEVREIADVLRKEGAERVIVVTSKSHTRRVKTIWKRLVGDSPRLVLRYATEDSYDGAHWWRHTSDALDVLREVLGLANAWAGFPVRPAGE